MGKKSIMEEDLHIPPFFPPSDCDHFLLDPRKGSEGLGQAGGQMKSAV